MVQNRVDLVILSVLVLHDLFILIGMIMVNLMKDTLVREEYKMTDFSVYDYEPVDIGGNTIYPIDDDGVLHLTKVAWRALAGLERYLTNKH